MDPRVVLYIEPATGEGGSGRSLMLLSEQLPEDRYLPIVAGAQDPCWLSEETINRGFEYHGQYLAPWLPAHVGWREFARLPNRINSVRRLSNLIRSNNVALVHTNSVATLDGAMAAKITGVPHIWHVRDQLDNPDHHRLFGGTAPSVRLLADLGDLTIAVSGPARHPFTQLKRPGRLVTIPNATSIPDLLPRESLNDIRERLQIPSDSLVGGIVGMLIDRKGQGDLLEAVRLLEPEFPTLHVMVVGSAHEGYDQTLKDQAATLKRPKNIHLLGRQGDVLSLMQAMDVMTQPSWSEGFGRTVIESMASATPVVASRVGGMIESVDDGVTGLLVPPKNPQALADALGSLLSQPDRAHEMGQAGRKKAAELYAPDNHAQMVCAAYDDLLGSSCR